MQRLIYILTVQSLLFHIAQTASLERQNQETREKEIKRLEKEKDELFKQINDAIDESVKSLQKANDTDSVIGITYIKDLKAQIKELNGSRLENPYGYNLGRMQNELDTRRRSGKDRGKDKRRQLVYQTADKNDKDMFDLTKIFGKKDSKKWKQRYENRVRMQKKLDEWLLQREIEKAKIKKYKHAASAQAGKAETCPREGIEKKKKGKDGGSSRKKFSGKYPCCRKCCKRSYMGCL